MDGEQKCRCQNEKAGAHSEHGRQGEWQEGQKEQKEIEREWQHRASCQPDTRYPFRPFETGDQQYDRIEKHQDIDRRVLEVDREGNRCVQCKSSNRHRESCE